MNITDIMSTKIKAVIWNDPVCSGVSQTIWSLDFTSLIPLEE